jgi:hypothetical protein
MSHIFNTLLIRYHEDGSKKLNACCLCISRMVYFNLNTEISSYYGLYISIFTCYLLPHLTHPLASHHYSTCLLTWRTNFFVMVANTHPPLSLVCQQLPHPLLALPTFHTPQFRLHYLHRRHQQLVLV